MLTPAGRIFFIVLGVLISLLSVLNDTYAGVLFGAFVVLYMLYDHYRNGSVWLANRAWVKGDAPRTKRLLAYTSKPEWLFATTRANYYLLLAQLAQLAGNLDQALELYQQAVVLPHEHDLNKTVAQVNIAQLHLLLGEPVLAAKAIGETAYLPKNETLMQKIEQILEALDSIRQSDTNTPA